MSYFKKRDEMLNYGKQTIDQEDIDSVIEVLKEDKYLTTGPKVVEFEEELCKFTGMNHAVVVSNGTAALHCATYASDISPGDEVIVTTMSFVASANCILYNGATPVFVDIDPETMNIDVDSVESKITSNTKAIVAVDFCGQLCDYEKLSAIAKKWNLLLIEDASHSLGVTRPKDGDLVTLSFHPVKNITTGEGGAVLTNDKYLADKIRLFRNHGIDTDYKSRKLHYYNMVDLGFNYRLTDIQSALGISQLKRLSDWVIKRQTIAKKYDEAFKKLSQYLEPLKVINPCAYHIYLLKLKSFDRDEFYTLLREKNIGVNVHYKPIHLQPYYQERFGLEFGMFPVSEKLYSKIITLPIFPLMTEKDSDDVIDSVNETVRQLINN